MGWLADLFREIPLSVIQQQKIADVEEKYSAAETENAGLKDDLRIARGVIAEVKQQVKELSHTDDLDNMEVEFLKIISAHESLTAEEIAMGLQLHLQRVRFHLHKLSGLRYISAPFSAFGESPIYHLEHKGREYLIRNNLL